MDTQQLVIIMGGLMGIMGIIKTIIFRWIDKNKGCNKVDCIKTIMMVIKNVK